MFNADCQKWRCLTTTTDTEMTLTFKKNGSSNQYLRSSVEAIYKQDSYKKKLLI